MNRLDLIDCILFVINYRKINGYYVIGLLGEVYLFMIYINGRLGIVDLVMLQHVRLFITVVLLLVLDFLIRIKDHGIYVIKFIC